MGMPKIKKLDFEPGAKKSIVIMGAMVSFCLLIAGIGIYFVSHHETKSQKTMMPEIGGEEIKSIGGDSDHAKKMKDADEESAAKAKAEGRTFLPQSSGAEENVLPGDNTQMSASAVIAAAKEGAAKAAEMGEKSLKSNGVSIPAFPPDSSSRNTLPSEALASDLRSPGYTAPPVQNSQNQPLTITVNNQQVTLPADPAARAQLLETLNEQERQRLAAEAANKHLALKMGRINEIASYLAKNEEYSAIKASDSWLAKPDPNAVTQSKITPAESSTPVTESNDLMIIKTGEKIYVNIETAINTDEPSNVFGKVLSGQARGWTIIGKAVQNPNYTVSVTFETLALPSGTSVAIKAMAIDPNTGRTSVQGDVNHKILDRFIIPVIAGGLGTYGDIMGRQGTTSTINPLTGTTGTVSSNMTTSQVRNAAIGGGVKNVTAVITAEAAKEKPSTSTDKNLGIEVVFLQEVLVNESILHKYAQKGAK